MSLLGNLFSKILGHSKPAPPSAPSAVPTPVARHFGGTAARADGEPGTCPCT